MTSDADLFPGARVRRDTTLPRRPGGPPREPDGSDNGALGTVVDGPHESGMQPRMWRVRWDDPNVADLNLSYAHNLALLAPPFPRVGARVRVESPASDDHGRRGVIVEDDPPGGDEDFRWVIRFDDERSETVERYYAEFLRPDDDPLHPGARVRCTHQALRARVGTIEGPGQNESGDPCWWVRFDELLPEGIPRRIVDGQDASVMLIAPDFLEPTGSPDPLVLPPEHIDRARVRRWRCTVSRPDGSTQESVVAPEEIAAVRRALAATRGLRYELTELEG